MWSDFLPSTVSGVRPWLAGTWQEAGRCFIIEGLSILLLRRGGVGPSVLRPSEGQALVEASLD